MSTETERQRFHNKLRIMRNLDRADLVIAGVIEDHDWEWLEFHTDPYTYFIFCDQNTCTKLWALIETREAHHATPPSPASA